MVVAIEEGDITVETTQAMRLIHRDKSTFTWQRLTEEPTSSRTECLTCNLSVLFSYSILLPFFSVLIKMQTQT